MAGVGDWDKIVIRHFLRGYGESKTLPSPQVTFPDKSKSKSGNPPKSIDALAVWESGRSLAIEHTLVQPFLDEKDKLRGKIGRVFEPLREPSLALRGHHVWLTVPLDGLPKGAAVTQVAKSVREWFLTIREGLPGGWSECAISNLTFDLRVGIFKQLIKGYTGLVSVRYFSPRIDDSALGGVIRKALDDKLDKLSEFKAKERFLLLEMDVRAYTAWDVKRHLDALKSDFPKLSQIDLVWIVDTSEITRQGKIFCETVWPDDIGEAGSFSMDWVGDELTPKDR